MSVTLLIGPIAILAKVSEEKSQLPIGSDEQQEGKRHGSTQRRRSLIVMAEWEEKHAGFLPTTGFRAFNCSALQASSIAR